MTTLTTLPCIACHRSVPALVLAADLTHHTPVTFCASCNQVLNTKAKRRKAIATWRVRNP